jgi:hypothetical protein
MDLVWLVYVISLLSGLNGMFALAAAASSMAFVFLLIYRAAECSQASYYSDADNKLRAEKAEWCMTHVKSALIVMICSSTVITFLPSEKTAYMMVGAYAAQKVAENEKVQETGGKVMNLINQKLDEYIDEGIEKVQKRGKK